MFFKNKLLIQLVSHKHLKKETDLKLESKSAS